MRCAFTWIGLLICAVGYSQTYKEIEQEAITIELGKSFTWVADYPAGTTVTFDVLDDNDEDVTELSANGTTCIIKGVALGSAKVFVYGGDKLYYRTVNVVAKGREKVDDTQEETTPTWTGSYRYSPPMDHYYIHTGSFIYAKIGSILIEKALESDGSLSYWKAYNLTSRKCKEYLEMDGFEHESTDGEYLDPDEWEGWKNFKPLDAFVDSEFYRSIKTDPANSLGDFYVGDELVLGVKCWVFDTDGYAGISMRYWIDPSNGCCLKYGGINNTGTFRVYYQVRKYDLHYDKWTPDVYESVLNKYL